MADRDREHLDRKFDRYTEMLPVRVQRLLRWVRSPSSGLFRIPLGILLVLMGIVGFLPVVGFWMAPLGILLLAQDLPFLQRPTRWALTRLERRWVEWKRRRGSSNTP